MKKEFDPKMHSVEHILNQTMDRMFGCGRCFTAHIEKKKSKCDYHYHRDISSDETKEIEKRVNYVINADLKVIEEYISKEEAKGYYNIDRLPSETGDKIRIVKIGDYDACPCIGPHINSTKKIGGFRIPHINSTKKIGGFRITSKSFEDGVLRIRFKLS
jgi:Ser-tRNA(Ala) deacylase AlaX